MNKNLFIATIGSLLEWAEFAFYAYLINKFSQLFFANFAENSALLFGFGTFAVGYIARPIGAIIFGYLGDCKGRKPALAYSLLIMGIATLGIGILPTYHSIGSLAPVALIILRFIQGLALSGEYTGAAIFLAEQQRNRSYLASSWVATFAAAGMLVGALAATLVSLPGMPDWAWRVPFFIGALSCGFGFYVRRNLEETAPFCEALQAKNVSANPFKELIKNHKIALLKTATLAAFVGSYIYTCNIWWLSFVLQRAYFTNAQAHFLATFAQSCVVLLTPLLALVADKTSGKVLINLGFIGGAIVSLLLFALSVHGNLPVICGVLIFYALFNTCVTAPMFKYLTAIFPTAIRYSGQAIGWNFAVAFFSGTAPLIAQLLADNLSLSFAPGVYVLIIAGLALITNNLNKSLVN